jgi:hypothetical protein
LLQTFFSFPLHFFLFKFLLLALGQSASISVILQSVSFVIRIGQADVIEV